MQTDESSPYGASPREIAAYRAAGTPNGDSREGFERWRAERKGPKGQPDPRTEPPPQPRTPPK
jgi:hypothetical protein